MAETPSALANTDGGAASPSILGPCIDPAATEPCTVSESFLLPAVYKIRPLKKLLLLKGRHDRI